MINGEGGRIAEENRVDYVMDQAETSATVWLGLTITCSRCHDHKYDPLTQRDYYQLFAFFNQTPVDGAGGSGQTRPVIEVPWRGAKEVKGKPEYPKVMVMEDMPKPRETFLLIRGSYEKPGEKLGAAVPASLATALPEPPRNRLGLARWLTARSNPLTARVTVNRAWQMFFGIGLVKTAEDFGVQGEKPSHPELLDWLAAEFVDSGWDVKKLHRLIVTSATYRQSSQGQPRAPRARPGEPAAGPRPAVPLAVVDDPRPGARGQRAAGRPQLGGPPVQALSAARASGKRPRSAIATYQQDQGEALYRRSLYTFWRRIVGPTAFFDTAARQVCVVKPTRTNTPLHALTTLNDVTYVEAARALAQRVLTTADRRARGSHRAGLPPGPRPLARAGRDERSCSPAWRASAAQFAVRPRGGEAAARASANRPRDARLDPIEHAAFTAVCLAIFNLDEALTKE